MELSLQTYNETGWNGFVSTTIGEARPTEPGVDNEISRIQRPRPEGADHCRCLYTWENGLSAAADVLYGSGFPKEALPLYNSIGISPYGLSGDRQDRFITNLSLQYMPKKTEAEPRWAAAFRFSTCSMTAPTSTSSASSAERDS